MMDLALIMEHIVLPPAEVLITMGETLNKLYIIKSGIVLANARVRSSGSVIGEGSLLSEHSHSKFAAQAMNYCQVRPAFG
jgi:CRP-like cAMP-binding protein